MQGEPCHMNVLLAQDPFGVQKRPRERRCLFERVQNRCYVRSISSRNAVRNIRIVTGRFSSRRPLGDFGHCDPISLNTARGRARIVRMDWLSAGIHQNTDVVITPMPTNLFQCFVEVTLGRPLNVRRLGSNLQNVFLVGDDLVSAAADDRNDYDYRQYNKYECSR
jgi:hypothetical protein